MSDTLPAAEQPSLNVADIQNAVAVIDHAADQGAFRTWDTITKVLDVRNKLAAFVAAANPPAEEGDAAEAEIDDEVEAEAEVEAEVEMVPAPKPAPKSAPRTTKPGAIKNPAPTTKKANR